MKSDYKINTLNIDLMLSKVLTTTYRLLSLSPSEYNHKYIGTVGDVAERIRGKISEACNKLRGSHFYSSQFYKQRKYNPLLI